MIYYLFPLEVLQIGVQLPFNREHPDPWKILPGTFFARTRSITGEHSDQDQIVINMFIS